MTDDGLQFLGAATPHGFTTLATSTWDGTPEPIVRELLQNALDAARAAERDRAEVVFTAAVAPIADLPGIDEYREHFEKAVEERAGDEQGTEERDTIRRISTVLADGSADVLFCRDNGQGLNGDRLRRVVIEGDSGKPTEGAGSKGLGHLTAFAASDLRYVLYAGRSRSPEGRLRDAASGHAILAARSSGGSNGTGIGGDGFLLRYGQMGLFGDSDAMFPDRVPALLAGEMNALTDTGSVVALLGFNGFRGEDDADPAEAIREVAAAHFLAAIAVGEMTVRVHGASGKEQAVERGTLAEIIGRNKNQRGGGATLPGEQAWRAWRVFDDGAARDLDCELDGVHIRFRSLAGEPVRDSRVQIYRDGMWITNKAPGLMPGDFGGNQPFDAVVMLTRGELYGLVRDAEGPEHRGLDRNRLVVGKNTKRWRTLRKLLRDVAARLREEAGERDDASAFVPADFAMFSGKTAREAETVRRYRPRTPPGPPDGSTTDGPGGQGKRGRGGKPGRPRGAGRGAAPKPGRAVPVRTSVVPRRDEDGEYRTLRVAWRLRDGVSAGFAGVRLRVPSGSDETCDQPLAPRWLKMRSIRHDGGVAAQARGGSGKEMVVPLVGGELEIALARPISNPNAIEIDVVHRRTADGDD